MGRRVGSAREPDRGRVGCTVCQRNLPQSAFSKAELSRSGAGRCRDCAQHAQCKKCGGYFRCSDRDDAGCCHRCRENSQVDLLLQTPKDEVTHFGAWQAACVQREFEHSVLLACQRSGLWERMVLQRILDFLRVPFITSHRGVQYCELCDAAFQDIAISQGQRLRMLQGSALAAWSGCPGPKLKFAEGESHAVAEVQRVANGCLFFRTLAKARPKRAPAAWRELSLRDVMSAAQISDDLQRDVFGFFHDQGFSKAGDLASMSDQYLSLALSELGETFTPDRRAAVAAVVARARDMARLASARVVPDEFVSLWAPVSATVEGRQPPPLAQHLQSSQHTTLAEAISSRRLVLVSRAALELAKDLGEQPTASLARFKVGLGITDRFCDPADLERARRLQRVRDSSIPAKFFQEVLPGRADFQWVTMDELADVEDKYAQRKGGRRSRRAA